MATWTLLLSGLTITNHVATDGIDIYYRANTTDIYQYDVSAGTANQIASSSDWNAGETLSTQGPANLCWFNGDLFVATIETIDASNDQPKVRKYNGGSWDVVYSGPTGGGHLAPQALLSNGSYIVLIYEAATAAGAHSSDGSSWSASTFSASSPNGYGAIYTGNDCRLGIATPGKDGSTYQTHKFNAGNWDVAETGLSNLIYHFSSQKDYFWKNDNGTYKRTTDFSTYVTPSDTSIIPAREAGIAPYSLGHKFSGGNAQFCPWNVATVEWGTAETIAAAATLQHFVVTNDKEIFALIGGNSIYQRDEPLVTYGLAPSQGGIPEALIP